MTIECSGCTPTVTTPVNSCDSWDEITAWIIKFDENDEIILCWFKLKQKNGRETSEFNETSGIGYSPLRAYESKYVYNYVEKNGYLYTANSIDVNRYFTSINRFNEQDRVSTNVDSAAWLHSEFTNEKLFEEGLQWNTFNCNLDVNWRQLTLINVN